MTESTPDFNQKHPLEHTWTLWFDNPNGRQKQATWGQTLRSVYTFNTVEDFWCLYNNILAPSRLIMGTDFHLFKEGIEPKWEDAKCAKGGKWTYFFPKSKEPAALDDCWLNLLLAMIGEQFCEPSEICGAVISVRQKQHRIALWTKTASNEADQMAIGRHFKSVLECLRTRRSDTWCTTMRSGLSGARRTDTPSETMNPNMYASRFDGQ